MPRAHARVALQPSSTGSAGCELPGSQYRTQSTASAAERAAPASGAVTFPPHVGHHSEKDAVKEASGG